MILFRWPNGVIPYALERGAFTQKERDIIAAAVGEYLSKTCLRYALKSYPNFIMTRESFASG